ncbi:DHA2 family efflux MFS transporter permease subunit [Alicyclobacillus sp. ALC3]|uniref:DHA2 family efflux MFS transporter permease subunit n=1 Tax=Alicyclobacillus sp. ALC3 TaxID=2796143 RepID=UPI0023782948|nr:DHA2 family efflux MFS transporter permease subunit [Alicyclobacillus sp. ALC3]WDL95827.1 DHA2 family efflux MFS transporter permease subunit [Alicyclobacillus sp. ALC3]
MSAQLASTEKEDISLRALLPPLFAIIVGMIMVILDNTVVNVAIPTLVKDFHSSLSVVQWTVTGYTLSLSAVIPLSGWLSDKLGAKTLFLLSIALFTLGSVLCSTADSAGLLITYRIIQGLGGGMVMPVGMAFVYRLAPPDKVGALMGMLGIPMLLAPAVGPILSGWFVEYSTWHWIFLINLPIGIVGIVFGLLWLPKIARKAAAALDVAGMFLGPIAFVALSYAVNEGGNDGWGATRTIVSLLIGVIVLIAFVIFELRQRQPLLELKTFRSGNFTRGVIVLWVSQIALFGAIIIVPLYLQNVREYSAFHTGLIMLPQAIAAAVFMPIGGRLFDKIGARPLAATGLGAVTAALVWLSQINTSTPLIETMIPLALMGAGMGMSMMPLNTHVLQAAPRELVSRVTPLTNAGQQVMVSFSVAGLTGFLTSRITSNMAAHDSLKAATISGFSDTYLLAAAIAMIGFVVSFVVTRPKRLEQGAISAIDVLPTH